MVHKYFGPKTHTRGMILRGATLDRAINSSVIATAACPSRDRFLIPWKESGQLRRRYGQMHLYAGHGDLVTVGSGHVLRAVDIMYRGCLVPPSGWSLIVIWLLILSLNQHLAAKARSWPFVLAGRSNGFCIKYFVGSLVATEQDLVTGSRIVRHAHLSESQTAQL